MMNAEDNKNQKSNQKSRLFESAQLFSGCKEVIIRHHGENYRLRVTKNGKLIMNK